MEFSRSVIPIGNGTILSAKHQNGNMLFLCKVDGAIVKRTILADKRSVGENRVVSLSDEAYFLGEGMLEKRGEALVYVS